MKDNCQSDSVILIDSILCRNNILKNSIANPINTLHCQLLYC